ncbi:hypothetical protein [Bradyrhizobium sp. USDA 336]|uniref:hypothetical protein n=1 Tax=Bradyrhizobium sp. USDA 336 TaxID=3156311 RepID=UPI003837763F
MLRALLFLLGLLGAFWSLAALPSFWRTILARDATTRIIADERLKVGALNDIMTRIQTDPVPSIQQPELPLAEALISLRIAGEAMDQKNPDKADRDMQTAQHHLISALRTSPLHSYLWLMLYSVDTMRNGFDLKAVSYLDKSYLTGPHEGWVALRRNRLALAIFPMLGDRRQEAVVSEFAEMVDADLTEEAAMNLKGIGWAQRDRLLAALGEVDVSSKNSLLKRLQADGINVKIPGLEYSERPWR